MNSNHSMQLRNMRAILLAAFLAGGISLAQAQPGGVKTDSRAPASGEVATAGGLEALPATGLHPALQERLAPPVDPEAVKLLRGMTDYMSGLKQFSLQARTMREDLLDSGHRVDFEIAAKVVVSRPNKLHAKRLGRLVDQDFFYDGKTLTMYNASHKVYATVPAPATIEETLDFARESLGIEQPVSDLVYRNAFPLLIRDVTLAMVVGKEVVGGISCTHLLFSRPGVDFQVWVADGGPPLPHKYVVTDTGTPELLSITTLMSDWNVAPGVADSHFTFVPPPGAKATTFLPIDTSSGTDR
jgi:hypothetical protein